MKRVEGARWAFTIKHDLFHSREKTDGDYVGNYIIEYTFLWKQKDTRERVIVLWWKRETNKKDNNNNNKEEYEREEGRGGGNRAAGAHKSVSPLDSRLNRDNRDGKGL